MMKLWIYENHIWGLQSEELFEGRSSQLYTQLNYDDEIMNIPIKQTSSLRAGCGIQGFESHTRLNFFFMLSFRNCISCVYNCDEVPSNNSFLHRSHIGFSYIHNFSIEQIKYSLFNCLVRWNKQVRWYCLSSRAFNLATALSKLTKINPSIFLDKSRKIEGPLLAG